jgi:hypothetical protein
MTRSNDVRAISNQSDIARVVTSEVRRPERISFRELLSIVAYNGHMRPQRRVMARRRMLKTGSIEFSETAIECTVRNMSEAGAALEVVSPIYIPDRFTLFIQSEQSKLTCRIVWRTGKRMGVSFR